MSRDAVERMIGIATIPHHEGTCLVDSCENIWMKRIKARLTTRIAMGGHDLQTRIFLSQSVPNLYLAILVCTQELILVKGMPTDAIHSP
jgi:hypothetical protein